jgi:hypothetical protein
MMPRTRNNLSASEVISGLQKHIRRGEEAPAMQAAAEIRKRITKERPESKGG